jgi:hypothetical protein
MWFNRWNVYSLNYRRSIFQRRLVGGSSPIRWKFHKHFTIVSYDRSEIITGLYYKHVKIVIYDCSHTVVCTIRIITYNCSLCGLFYKHIKVVIYYCNLHLYIRIIIVNDASRVTLNSGITYIIKYNRNLYIIQGPMLWDFLPVIYKFS